jgi:hypothetical protein
MLCLESIYLVSIEWAFGNAFSVPVNVPAGDAVVGSFTVASPDAIFVAARAVLVAHLGAAVRALRAGRSN